MNDYVTVVADEALEADVRALVRLAVTEDIRRYVDWTSLCVLDEGTQGVCDVVTRADGVCAGLVALPWIIDEFNVDVDCLVTADDGTRMTRGQTLARLSGRARDLLQCERTILNLVSRLSGVSTLTSHYVSALCESKASIYDTRKTTPGWRLLEKYAVACGGGKNHRRGLYDGFLIKDNHLQLAGTSGKPMEPSDAVEKALQWRGRQVNQMTAPAIVEIEVDTLGQLENVLPVGPDIVLLDNFELDEISAAVAMRDQLNPKVQLEVSGNVTIQTIAAIGATGVERISSGALTHQATWLDIGLDWVDASTT